MKAKVSLNLARLTVPVKIEKARQVVTALTEQATIFVAPTPNLATITSAVNDLETAYTHAQDGGKSKTAWMHTKENALDDLLTKLGHYVEDTGSGNADIILLSGFDVRNPKTPVRDLVTPTNLEASTSDATGRINLHWKPVDNAVTYIIEMNSSNSNWTQIGIVTKAKHTAKNLIPGTRYSFRIAAVGTPGTSPFSDSASAMSV